MTTLALAERALTWRRGAEAHQRLRQPGPAAPAEYSPSWLRAQDLQNEAQRLIAKKKKELNGTGAQTAPAAGLVTPIRRICG